jgi:5'(3')-deoxyribonucleotidase
MRKIIIDIDNTLWDLAPVLYQRMKEVAPSIPPPAQWSKWDFWEGFAPEKTLYATIRDIHLHQDEFGVYPDARQFLTSLKEKGFYIIIASHREKGTIHAARRWLKKHALPFDEVHLSYDKSVLFNDAWAIIDDSPGTLDKALKTGIVRAGLRNPWNKNEDHPLFDNLMEIYAYLQGQCASKKP